MALAGQREVVVAIEADFAGVARRACGERRDRRPGARLAFLTAEAATHPPCFHGDEGVRYSEDAGDDVLGLRRILGRSVHRHLVPFAGKSERCLALEIEMLLAADRKLAIQPARRLVDHGRGVASAEGIVVLNPRAANERIGDRDGRRPGLDVDLSEPGRPACLVARARHDGEKRLTVEHYLLVDEQRLIGENRRNVVLARNIRRRQNHDDAGGAAHRLQAQALQFAGGLSGHADRDMQRARGLPNVVDVSRRALDMQAGGIVRQRLMNDRGRGRVEDG